MPQYHEDYVQRIQENRTSFENGVIHLEAMLVLTRRNSVVLVLNIQDMWDVETIKFSIDSKLFARRFIYWLKDNGLSLSMEEQEQVNVEIIDIITKEGDFSKGKWYILMNILYIVAILH